MHQPLADLRRTALVGLADVSLEVLVVLKREHVFSSSARNEFDQTVAQGEVSHEPTSADEIPVELASSSGCPSTTTHGTYRCGGTRASVWFAYLSSSWRR